MPGAFLISHTLLNIFLISLMIWFFIAPQTDKLLIVHHIVTLVFMTLPVKGAWIYSFL